MDFVEDPVSLEKGNQIRKKEKTTITGGPCEYKTEDRTIKRPHEKEKGDEAASEDPTTW